MSGFVWRHSGSPPHAWQSPLRRPVFRSGWRKKGPGAASVKKVYVGVQKKRSPHAWRSPLRTPVSVVFPRGGMTGQETVSRLIWRHSVFRSPHLTVRSRSSHLTVTYAHAFGKGEGERGHSRGSGDRGQGGREARGGKQETAGWGRDGGSRSPAVAEDCTGHTWQPFLHVPFCSSGAGRVMKGLEGSGCGRKEGKSKQPRPPNPPHTPRSSPP